MWPAHTLGTLLYSCTFAFFLRVIHRSGQKPRGSGRVRSGIRVARSDPWEFEYLLTRGPTRRDQVPDPRRALFMLFATDAHFT